MPDLPILGDEAFCREREVENLVPMIQLAADGVTDFSGLACALGICVLSVQVPAKTS